jgi:hypothetical protein
MGSFDLLKEPRSLVDGEVAAKILTAVLAQPKAKPLLSSEHFSVDSTLIEAWAAMKNFKLKGKRGDDGTFIGCDSEAD